MESKTANYQPPPFTASPASRTAWVEEQIKEGEGWLEGQRAYRDVQKNLRTFDAVFNDENRSTLVTNELKYDIRKFVESVSKVREIGTFGSDAAQFKAYAQMMNKLVRAVYLESDFTFQLRRTMQYASVMGRGYLWTKCKADDYGFGERKIVFEPLSILDVVPVQVPSTNDVQDAYNATIYEYMPIAEAHGRFPRFQSQLKPMDLIGGKMSTVGARRADFAEKFRYGTRLRGFGNLYCEIRYTFVRDLALNNYGKELPMGEPNTSWFYKVPFIGQEVAGPIVGGQRTNRKAGAFDARIYPTLRLIITHPGMTEPMYDGPAFDWHGKIPPVQYDVDDWPWQGIGNSLVGDVGSIERTTRKIERLVDQSISASLNPPMGYDRSSTGGPKIESFDIFEPNVRTGVDGKPTDVLHSLLPDSVRPDSLHFKFLEYLAQRKGKQLGLEDLGALAQLKMNIGSEQADKILEGIGPVAEGIANNVERGNAKVAHQLKFMIPQWFDTARVVSIIGPDSLSPEVFDFDPHSLIPSHGLDELLATPAGATSPAQASAYSQLERARMFARAVRLTSIPSTLLRITQMQEQMKYLQLQRGGFPIAAVDVAKKLDIDNYGEVPGDTGRERWLNEQKQTLQMQAEVAQYAAQLGLTGGDGQQGGGGGKGHGGGGRPGRKPSGQAPPKLRQKGDGRTTITESK